jgi:adenosylhomocysteinase
MDLSFAGQLNAMMWMREHGKDLDPDVYEFPEELDRKTALMKLETMGISIDEWTEEQERYARAYAEGT